MTPLFQCTIFPNGKRYHLSHFTVFFHLFVVSLYWIYFTLFSSNYLFLLGGTLIVLKLTIKNKNYPQKNKTGRRTCYNSYCNGSVGVLGLCCTEQLFLYFTFFSSKNQHGELKCLGPSSALTRKSKNNSVCVLPSFISIIKTIYFLSFPLQFTLKSTYPHGQDI